MVRSVRVALAALSATAIVSLGVWASNIPLVTGPLEPANLVGHINALTQRINFGVSGLNASLTTSYTTSTTSAETALTASLPASQLALGNTLHYFVSGVNSADANAKTVTFNYGAANCSVVVTASAAKWVAQAWVTVNGAATQALTCYGQQGATAITVNQTTGSVNNAAAVSATIQMTAATSGTMQALQAWIDQIK